MRTKLLRRLRAEGRDVITIYSIKTRGGLVVGMSYGCPSDDYHGLFSLGDDENDVRDKAMRIYIEKEIERRRKKNSKRKERRG